MVRCILSHEQSLSQLVLCMVFLDRKGAEEQLFIGSSPVAVRASCAVEPVLCVWRSEDSVAWAHLALVSACSCYSSKGATLPSQQRPRRGMNT